MSFKLPILLATVFAGTAVYADAFSDKAVENLKADGFTSFEVENGPTRTKIEAIRGEEKLEVIYDRATGEILSQEISLADDQEEDQDTEHDKSDNDENDQDDSETDHAEDHDDDNGPEGHDDDDEDESDNDDHDQDDDDEDDEDDDDDDDDDDEEDDD